MGLPACACRVRALRTEDRDGLLGMIARCSPDSLYQRFMVYSPRAPLEYVQAILCDPDCYTAIAEHHDEGAPHIVGEASLSFDGSSKAEIALLVGDEFQGMGVGELLTRHLCAAAVHRGLLCLKATALTHNIAIVRLFRRVAATTAISPPEAGVVSITLRLHGEQRQER